MGRESTGNGQVGAILARIREKGKKWGVPLSLIADDLGTSRQYVWQVLRGRGHISLEKVLEVEAAVDNHISRIQQSRTLGERLRAARRSAGLTLKQVAGMIGYSWVGVERWEKDICRPKPGVLWHLASIYGPAGHTFIVPALAQVIPEAHYGPRHELAAGARRASPAFLMQRSAPAPAGA